MRDVRFLMIMSREVWLMRWLYVSIRPWISIVVRVVLVRLMMMYVRMISVPDFGDVSDETQVLIGRIVNYSLSSVGLLQLVKTFNSSVPVTAFFSFLNISSVRIVDSIFVLVRSDYLEINIYYWIIQFSSKSLKSLMERLCNKTIIVAPNKST